MKHDKMLALGVLVVCATGAASVDSLRFNHEDVITAGLIFAAGNITTDRYFVGAQECHNIVGSCLGGVLYRPYAEMWNYTTDGWNFDIDDADVYYNLTGLIAGNLEGFTFTGENGSNGGSFLTAQYAGLYKTMFSMSFSSEAQGGLYGISLAHDYDPDTHRDCYSRRSAKTDTGSVSVSCLMDLDVGDQVVVMIENEVGARDITIYTANLNILKV